MSPKSESAPRELFAAQVQAWLKKHPNFLAGRPGLLEQMQLPQDSDGTISFQAYQARRLREHNAHLEAMFQMASRNQKLIDHALILAAESLQDRPGTLGAAIQAQENACFAISRTPVGRFGCDRKFHALPPNTRFPNTRAPDSRDHDRFPEGSADPDGSRNRTDAVAEIKRRFGHLGHCAPEAETALRHTLPGIAAGHRP